jgi:hypothetical protein
MLQEFPDMTRRRRRLVKRQLSLNYWDVGYDRFDRLLFAQARKYFAASLNCDWRNKRALVYLAATCLPATLAKSVRALKRDVL